jgi:hypothetical protein
MKRKLFYVVFEKVAPDERRELPWLWRYFGGGVHCSVLMPVGTSALICAPHPSGVDFVYCEDDVGSDLYIPCLIDQILKKDGVLVVKIWHTSQRLGFFDCTPPTCVSVVKGAMGLRSMVFTPKGLYTALVRMGGKVLKKEA